MTATFPAPLPVASLDAMSGSARLLAFVATLACSACAAGGASAPSASALIDTDRPCLTGRWRADAEGSAIMAEVENRCGRALTCDVHLGFMTLAGPELYLEMSRAIGAHRNA